MRKFSHTIKHATNLWLMLLLLDMGGSSFLSAQTNIKSQEFYYGLGASFGLGFQNITSDYQAISDLKLSQEGGSILAVAGNRIMQIKGEAGWYYSTSAVPQTVDLLKFAFQTDLKPLALMKHYTGNFNPYLSVGVNLNRQQFFGMYDREYSGITNHSISDLPYLGAIRDLDGFVGGGVEYSMHIEGQFLTLFAECKKSVTRISSVSSDRFSTTDISGCTVFNIGMLFGIRRF